jgi:hypothetical protein
MFAINAAGIKECATLPSDCDEIHPEAVPFVQRLIAGHDPERVAQALVREFDSYEPWESQISYWVGWVVEEFDGEYFDDKLAEAREDFEASQCDEVADWNRTYNEMKGREARAINAEMRASRRW